MKLFDALASVSYKAYAFVVPSAIIIISMATPFTLSSNEIDITDLSTVNNAISELSDMIKDNVKLFSAILLISGIFVSSLGNLFDIANYRYTDKIRPDDATSNDLSKQKTKAKFLFRLKSMILSLKEARKYIHNDKFFDIGNIDTESRNEVKEYVKNSLIKISSESEDISDYHLYLIARDYCKSRSFEIEPEKERNIELFYRNVTGALSASLVLLFGLIGFYGIRSLACCEASSESLNCAFFDKMFFYSLIEFVVLFFLFSSSFFQHRRQLKKRFLNTLSVAYTLLRNKPEP